jgi:hypothetical protein
MRAFQEKTPNYKNIICIIFVHIILQLLPIVGELFGICEQARFHENNIANNLTKQKQKVNKSRTKYLLTPRPGAALAVVKYFLLFFSIKKPRRSGVFLLDVRLAIAAAIANIRQRLPIGIEVAILATLA